MSSSEKIRDAIGEIDDNFISEYRMLKDAAAHKRVLFRRYLAMAACFSIVVLAAVYGLKLSNQDDNRQLVMESETITPTLIPTKTPKTTEAPGSTKAPSEAEGSEEPEQIYSIANQDNEHESPVIEHHFLRPDFLPSNPQVPESDLYAQAPDTVPDNKPAVTPGTGDTVTDVPVIPDEKPSVTPGTDDIETEQPWYPEDKPTAEPTFEPDQEYPVATPPWDGPIDAVSPAPTATPLATPDSDGSTHPPIYAEPSEYPVTPPDF